ncbi:hypothetical protein B0I35DRAFT_339320, partial [Stachybotrys elegans]
STLRAAPVSFAGSPLLARHAGLVLALVAAAAVASNWYIASWWLAEPHRGYGVKWGKTWYGRPARDTTELAYWTAGFAQVSFSVGALAMLLQRGHSGGQSYAIWFCRFVGTLMGLPICVGLLGWYWPEAHGFVWEPASIIMLSAGIVCDIAYPFLLAYVRSTEKVLPDGTIIMGDAVA